MRDVEVHKKYGSRMTKYILILCLILSGCTALKHLTGDVECPPDEHCVDLTHRIENDIFLELKPMKGWRQTGCVHSKMLDPTSIVEQMYCEYCNKEDHQMWMIYDYGDETWNMGEEEWLNVCGTPHPLWNKALHMKAQKALDKKASEKTGRREK